MRKKSTTMMNVDEIRNLFMEDCKEGGEIFVDENFQKFLNFLEIDFYDWAKENLKQFNLTKN
ncbi:MAG: hypothetical protein ABIJ23_00260 [Candidatus Magasanikbacteria bacterium]